MAGIMQRVFALLCLFLLSVRVAGFADLQSILADNGELTEFGQKKVISGAAVNQSDDTTPMHLQTGPAPYAIENGTAQFFLDKGSKRTTMKYGPFTVQSMDDHNGMVDYLLLKAPMPCNDCTITYMVAGLEYPNGSYANANTSLWLHHTVFINIMHPDTVCGSNYYGKGQRWFASGNERTIANWCLDGTVPVGYYLGNDDYNVIEIELMNQEMAAQDAVMTIEYEYIPGKPDGFYDLTPMWLDIGGCQVASDMPPLTNTTFSYSMNQTYSPNWSGALVSMGTHLHDGGIHINVTNKQETVCDSMSYYGGPGYVGPTMDMDSSMAGMTMKHISYMSSCYSPYIGMVSPGDEWGLTAWYNFTEWPGMTNTDGSLADIMGISIVYAAANMTEAEISKYVGTETLDPTPPQPASASSMMYPPTSTAGMGGMAGMGNMGSMTCNPASDSPGNLTADGVDLSDPDQAMDFLAAILDDTCLQVWSNSYARAFWYGMIVVIGLFAVTNVSQKIVLAHRKRVAANGGTLRPTNSVIGALYGAYRSVSYPSVGLSPGVSRILGIPTLGTSLMIASYMGFLMALNFIRVQTHDDQNLQSISIRAAWLSITQLPLILLLTMKRNLIGWLTDVGYERLNVFHRWTSRGLLLTATIHFGTQNVGWARVGLMQLEWTTDSCPITGIAAYAILLWINLSSLRPFRSMAYELFVIQHFVTFVGFIVALMLHIPSTAQYATVYVWVSIGLYLLFKVIQAVMIVFRNFPTLSRATFTLVSSSTSSIGKSDPVVRVNVKAGKLKSWRPGSHVRLMVPRFGLVESHPATIASTPSSAGGDLVFFLQSHRGFTRRITRSAMDATAVQHRAIVDGPYGGLPVDMSAFECAVLVAGSTGVTFTLPILLDLAERVSLAGSKSLPLRNVVFVWAVRRQDHVAWVEEQVASAQAALSASGVNCEVLLHVTRETIRVPSMAAQKSSGQSSPERSAAGSRASGDGSDAIEGEVVNEKSGDGKDGGRPTHVRTRTTGSSGSSASGSTAAANSNTFSNSTPSGGAYLPLAAGRPDVRGALADARRRFAGEMGVAVCGPSDMAADVRNAVAKMQLGSGRKKKEGGVWLHVEGFSW